jgi:hypothetical protein
MCSRCATNRQLTYDIPDLPNRPWNRILQALSVWNLVIQAHAKASPDCANTEGQGGISIERLAG